MPYSEDIQALLKKEMTRKQFVVHMGLAILAVAGLPSLLKNINGAVFKPKVDVAGSYGYGAYSGLPEGQKQGLHLK